MTNLPSSSSPPPSASPLARLLPVVLAVVVALYVAYTRQPAPAPTYPPATSTASAASRAAPGPASARPLPAARDDHGGHGGGAGFHSYEQWQEHFHKHGAEFGATDAQDYLRRAQALRDRPAGGAVLEMARPDGARCRFDRETGAFLAYNHDGTIRTFFRPRDGEAYFLRQRDRDQP